MSSINVSSPVPTESTIDFICYSETVSFPWLLIARKFHRFSDKKHEDSAHSVKFSLLTVRKLHQALTTDDRPVMNDNDVELLNWLVLRDFRDAYKMYSTSTPDSPPTPTSNATNPVNDGITWAQRRALVSK